MVEITTTLICLWNETFDIDNAIKTFLVVGSGSVHYFAGSDLRMILARDNYPFRYSGSSSVPDETIDLFVSLADALQ